MDLKPILPRLLPLAIAWAEAESQSAAQNGAPLTGVEQRLARVVGVQSPGLVRVAVVSHVPQPRHPQLRMAVQQAGLLGSGVAGLTLGHTVFITRGYKTVRLLSHELRHVHQYEQLGSIAAFLPVYLAQIVEDGYDNAAFEVDARAHEIHDF